MAFFCINCKSETSPDYKACPFCGEPITEFLRRYIEAPLDGKYKIVSRLGIGGMGEVYKVLHLHLNALRVVKLMRATISSDPAANERFVREARLATRINHPNVASLFDFATLDDGTHYMVWEYIEGMTLAELLRVRGALSPRYAAQLAIQALAGLEAIHRSGVVHRDVSPENIMITRDEDGAERIKIIDLGIAKQSSDTGESKTQTGMFVGKWKYCSPEQLGVLKPGETIDRRADLYSFGIVMYEMLAGTVPFVADSPHRYLLMHATETPRPLSEVRADLGTASELEALVFRALDKDRERRFASARQFGAALETIAQQLTDAEPDFEVKRREEDEETAEHLLVAQTEVNEAQAEPTLITLDRPAPEEVRAQSKPVGLKTLVGAPAVDDRNEAAPPRRKWPAFAAAAALLLVTGAVAVPLLNRSNEASHGDTVVAPVSQQQQPQVVAATTFPVAPVESVATPQVADGEGTLAIQTFPWSEIKSVRNVTTGQTVDVGATAITPARLVVPAGRYEVTLQRGGSRPQIIERTVRAGDSALVAVAMDQSTELPDFGVEQ